MPKNIDEKTSEDILKGFVIPPKPQIVADIQIESAMPEPDIKVIASLITQDAGISGAVLKAINSPLFGLAGKVKSVSHAASLMGLGSIVNIVTALSLKNTLSDESVTELNRFWDTTMDVATASTIVAKYLGTVSSDKAYLMGLFHDCGIPLMMMRYEGYLSVLEKGYDDPSGNILKAENDAFHADHSVLGFYIAKAWQVDKTISEVISVHHCAQKVLGNHDKGHTEKKDLLVVLKLAEHVCHSYKTLGKCVVDHEWLAIKDLLLDYAGIDEDDILNIADEVKESGIG